MVDNPDTERQPAPGCSFCKTPREFRAVMLVNNDGDCAICDVCVAAMYPVVTRAYRASGGNPYDIPEGVVKQ